MAADAACSGEDILRRRTVVYAGLDYRRIASLLRQHKYREYVSLGLKDEMILAQPFRSLEMLRQSFAV